MHFKIENYFKDIEAEVNLKSKSIRRDFKNHSTSSGEKSENLVFEFLKAHLPKKFNISLNSFVLDSKGTVSNEIDILISDSFNNSPYYSSGRREYWPVESIYLSIEVKTSLKNYEELEDALDKCRKFKQMKRKFLESKNKETQYIKETLFCIWGFDSAPRKNFEKQLLQKINKIPIKERPDFIVVPDKFVCHGG